MSLGLGTGNIKIKMSMVMFGPGFEHINTDSVHSVHIISTPLSRVMDNGTSVFATEFPCAYSLSYFGQSCLIFISNVFFSCQKYIKY